MTNEEREVMKAALGKIPCAVSVATDQGRGAAWLGCRECGRCLLIRAMHFPDQEWMEFATEWIIKKLPDNGGHRLRPDLEGKKENNRGS